MRRTRRGIPDASIRVKWKSRFAAAIAGTSPSAAARSTSRWIPSSAPTVPSGIRTAARRTASVSRSSRIR